MSSSRPAVTPTTSTFPSSDALFSSTPPLAPSAFFAGPGSHTSPSPRSRSHRTNRSRDLANPGSRSHFYHLDAIDNNPPADPDRPSAPAVHPATTYSTFPSNPPRSSSLAARNPPRTSSLLPPARIVVDPGTPHADAPELRDPFNDPRPAPKIPDSARERDWKHKRGHSRSSSAGGLSDTLRNLNRWSASTTSSRASHIADFTRRIRNRNEPAATTTLAPLQSLPQISTGPSLEDEVLEAHALRQFSLEQPEQAPQPQQDSGRFWDDQGDAEEEQGSSSFQAHLAEPPPATMVMNGSTMPYTQNGQVRGHSRSRSTGAKGSADTTVSSRSRDKDRDRERDRDRHGKPMSQKAMLSKALQKANTAVQLDNAQNLEGARRAYAEACTVLQQVLLRTSGEEDRRKLEAILPAQSTQLAPPLPQLGHKRAGSHESVSWLDPIDESEHSSVTSVHSRSSSRVVRKHIRAASGATEAEFDAALDDAIEAAYDDGYDPEAQYSEHPFHDAQVDPIANTLRRVEIARELVRESEREALELANEREQRLRRQQQLEDEEYRRQEAIGEDEFYDGNDSEEDERLLEQMTQGNTIQDFSFGVQPRPPVPRESDSSGMTGRTWHSSMGSNPPTGTTLLTPVSEDNGLPHPSGPLPALPPHAMAPLPPPPTSAGSQGSGQSVRNRRLSGQNPKELKIETTQLAPAAPATAGPAIPSMPKAGSYIVQQRQALSAGPNRTAGPFSARLGPSPIPGTLDEEPDDTPLPPLAFSQEDYSRVGTPSVVRPNLRKNYSASSLKSLKTRNLSISHMEDTPDHSPGTPLSTQFGSRLPAMPSLPPGLVKDRTNSATTSGLHLFENHFHSTDDLGSPNPLHPDAPAPLEPCPSDVTLRPFWLMRALYQTLCHSRGGYLSTKLFVPRDVWRVKGVKLKGIEDKIANCDLLTAALQKLARVDTCDADAVLEEMQALEGVLEQVQSNLSRRLGSDVGVQGAGAMFKDAAAAGAGDGTDPASMPRSASVAGKASSFSWRRLRSKNSSANLPGLATGYGGKGGGGGNVGGGASSTNLHEGMGKDMAIASLPMTSHPTSRPTKRDVGGVAFGGPNANYMASLARLFDAAQTVDQVARQVDDPGLRHADKTQVGIELCTRHAAEFFAFYVCRFALADLTLLLDKFVKRGTEWVLV
ncbi:hypothetical protein F5144DRAFT_596421 [Chaetomium tenue]|uniref:Uncharacterized protein n=1 Tax=Chaetomium tenue TaxID=1854479 RepID=A0ACB7NXB7_9PEZI|nr:hypothetical protein F5144DRAFT_596421 [Chaetomium globosum]